MKSHPSGFSNTRIALIKLITPFAKPLSLIKIAVIVNLFTIVNGYLTEQPAFYVYLKSIYYSIDILAAIYLTKIFLMYPHANLFTNLNEIVIPKPKLSKPSPILTYINQIGQQTYFWPILLYTSMIFPLFLLFTLASSELTFLPQIVGLILSGITLFLFLLICFCVFYILFRIIIILLIKFMQLIWNYLGQVEFKIE